MTWSSARRVGASGRWLWIGVGGLLAVAVAVTAAVWLWPGRNPEPPRARQYVDYTGCLLTGETGITDPQAAPIWEGMQEASATTRARLQYASVPGPQTTEQALPFLYGLVGGCDLLVASGEAASGAVRQGASRLPAVRFVLVNTSGPAMKNVVYIQEAAPSDVRDAVAAAMTTAVEAALVTG